MCHIKEVRLKRISFEYIVRKKDHSKSTAKMPGEYIFLIINNFLKIMKIFS